MGFERGGLKSPAWFCLCADALESLQPAKLSTFHVGLRRSRLARVSSGAPHVPSLLHVWDGGNLILTSAFGLCADAWLRLSRIYCKWMLADVVRDQ